jgi:hypothetical protein
MSAPWDEDMINFLKVNMGETFRDAHFAHLEWSLSIWTL